MENKLNNILEKLTNINTDISTKYKADQTNEYLRGAFETISDVLEIMSDEIYELLDEE